MRIVTMNIQHGLTEEGTIGDLVAVGREVAQLDADVVAVQEVDYRQPRSLFANQLDQLRTGLGWRPDSAYLGAFFSGCANVVRLPALTGPGRRLPSRLMRRGLSASSPAIGGYGLALLTHLPVRRVLRQRLGSSPARLRRVDGSGMLHTGWSLNMGQNRTLLAAEIDVDGLPCRVASGHFELGRPTACAQLAHSWRVLNAGWQDYPAFLAGDMNLPAQLVQQVTGVGEDLDASAPTFPADDPVSTIDHVLGAGAVRLDAVATRRLSVGDHLALIADFTLER